MQIRKDLDWLAWLRAKNTWKKIEKRSLENQIFNSLIQEILSNIFDLMHSLQRLDQKPNRARLSAAPKSICKTWNFGQKVQNCKPLYRSIQSTRLGSIASLKVPERVPIHIIHSNSNNWYIEPKLHQENSTIVHHDSRILCIFYLLIHVHYDILMLTNIFNCIFVRYIRLCHVWVLGFSEVGIGDFQTRKNWDSKPPPLDSACSDEEETPTAPNLWMPEL